MASLSYFQCIDREVFAVSSLTANYQALNGSGFSDDIKILKVINEGNVGVDISYDGVNDHDYYPAETDTVLDLQTNHANNSSNGSGTLGGRKGQIIYGKGTAGSGNLYIIGYK